MKPTRLLPLAITTLGLVVSALFTGCQSVIEPSKTTTEFQKDTVVGLTGISKSVNNVATAIAPDSTAVQKRVKELEAESAQLREAMSRAKAEADRKNEELKEKIKDGLVDAAAEATRIAGALTGTGVLGDKLATLISRDVAPALEAAKKVQQNLDATRAEIAAKEAQQKKDIGQALTEFAKLSSEQKNAAREELIKLAQEKGIKGAEGMTTDQLIAALGAAGIGLAGLLRTFGPSRGAKEVGQVVTTQGEQEKQIKTASKNVDDLWTDIATLDKKVGVLEQRADDCDCPTLHTGLAKLTGTLDDHERRLDLGEDKTKSLS